MEKGQFTQSGFPDQANCPFEMISYDTPQAAGSSAAGVSGSVGAVSSAGTSAGSSAGSSADSVDSVMERLK